MSLCDTTLEQTGLQEGEIPREAPLNLGALAATEDVQALGLPCGCSYQPWRVSSAFALLSVAQLASRSFPCPFFGLCSCL